MDGSGDEIDITKVYHSFLPEFMNKILYVHNIFCVDINFYTNLYRFKHNKSYNSHIYIVI